MLMYPTDSEIAEQLMHVETLFPDATLIFLYPAANILVIQSCYCTNIFKLKGARTPP